MHRIRDRPKCPVHYKQIVHCKSGQARYTKPIPLTEKGQVELMKKINIIFLSVILALAMTACNGGKNNASNQTEKQTESIMATEEAAKATEAVTKTEAEATQEIVSEAESESEVQTTEPEENRMPEQVAEKEETASQNNNNSSPKEEPEQKNDTDFENCGGSSDSNEGQSEKEESGNSNEESGFAAYNPQNVVSLATAKCQAGGMITIQQNLDNLLAAGKITQEEYNEYYPYDGMEQSYYSVFVETDLNTASTLSGKRLPTEDAIAEYIAGMLLLENDPVFYISYEGIYTTGGTDFYEFRCHRQ